MPEFTSIAFVVQQQQGGSFAGVVPMVGGASLLELIAQFEARGGFEAAGGYAALTDHPGTLLAYYLGETDAECCDEGKTALLGCTCGVPDCWPLCCRIRASPNSVVWSGFEQPFRRERDYEGFGPFVFDRGEYEAALVALARDARS